MEKCSELGAEALQPLLTERSPALGRGGDGDSDDDGASTGGRLGRWERLAQASAKQSLRVHTLQARTVPGANPN